MDLARRIAPPVALLIGVLALIWWKGHQKPNTLAAQTEFVRSDTAPGPTPALPQPDTEGRWMIDEVARDIAEMILFATDKKAAPDQALKLTVIRARGDATYELAVTGPKGNVSHTINVKHHAWSPADHAPWAAALLKAWQPPKSSGTAPDGHALTRNLTDPTIATIIREERKVSGLLNQQPLEAELHEQAALVIATFALREAAGNNFSDVRPALCRIGAHLALSRSLRTEPGVCGQLAEVVQLTLATRQAEALERIARLPGGLEPWVTTLKMRNTGDWRMCTEPGKATLLEQIAWARTVVQAVGPTPLQVFLEKYHPAEVPDWSRAVFAKGFGVEHGHVFAADSLSREFADLAAAWKAWSGSPLKKDDLIMVLNDPARRAIVKSAGGTQLAVLGWGQIASQQQRHLCNALYFTDYFLRDLWGVPEEATSLEREIHGRFSGLRLYPLLVRCLMCADAGQVIPDPVFAKAMRDAVELCKNQPQIVSTANWALLTEPCGRPMPVMPPPPGGWFQPSLPHGTAFDFEHRINDLHLPPGSEDLWSRSLALAPYDFEIIRSVASRDASDLLPVERDRQAFKNVSAFHLGAMRHIANNVKGDPKAYAAALKPACALDPDLYLKVGEVLLHAGLEEEAADAYQAAFEKAPDRVGVSNQCDWIVNYYFDHNRKDEAVRIAEDAAEVYSYRGLETAGKLMERMEKWEDAAAHFAAIAERYGSSGPLMGFLSRNKDRDPKIVELFNKIAGAQFPEGMKKAALPDFTEAPENGAQITSESDMTRQWGLNIGDIIVALDGVRVESFPQYDLVRALQPSAIPLALIVWDGSQYREISAQVPDRKFGCGMETYQK